MKRAWLLELWCAALVVTLAIVARPALAEECDHEPCIDEQGDFCSFADPVIWAEVCGGGGGGGGQDPGCMRCVPCGSNTCCSPVGGSGQTGKVQCNEVQNPVPGCTPLPCPPGQQCVPCPKNCEPQGPSCSYSP